MAWYKVSEETLKVIQLFFPEWSAIPCQGDTCLRETKKRQRWNSFWFAHLSFPLFAQTANVKNSVSNIFAIRKLGHNSFLIKIYRQPMTHTVNIIVFYQIARDIFALFIAVRWSRIGLVWDNRTGPHPTGPTFWTDYWNPLQTEINYLWGVLSWSQDDIRWF